MSEVENPNGEQSDIRMAVSDGYKLVFSYKSSDGKWIKAGNEIDASPYVPWGMGFCRGGIVALFAGCQQHSQGEQRRDHKQKTFHSIAPFRVSVSV